MQNRLVLGLALAVFLGCLAESSPAWAGRRAFAFTWDAETLAQGDVELEEWLWGRVPATPTSSAASGWIWLGPVYGVSRRVEVALPWEAVTTPAATRVVDFTAEARIQLLDPQDDSLFVHPLLRVFYQLNFNHPLALGKDNRPWVGANAVVAFGPPKGSHATVDVGFFGDTVFRTVEYQTLGAGYTHVLTPELRAGGEYYHELSFGAASHDVQRFFVGPTASFSRGPLWATLGILFGLNSSAPTSQPRLMIGVTF